MARYLANGKRIRCWRCEHSFAIKEQHLRQPSYEVRVDCPDCGAEQSDYTIWSTYDKQGRRLFERTTEELFQEAIDTLGFLPTRDCDRLPITFTSDIHRESVDVEGYSLVEDYI